MKIIINHLFFCFHLGHPDAVLVIQAGGASRVQHVAERRGQIAEAAIGAQPLSPHTPVAVGGVGLLMF